MISVHCPVCSGPLHWHDEIAEHLVGHSPADGGLAETLGRHLTQALWSAIRALEDSAAGTRWRLSQPDAPAMLTRELDELQHDIDVLRELVRSPSRQGTPQPS